jgi:hypothetical protein
MKILVACEESQAVTMAFREHGHEAYSCDIVECSGGHPEWHLCQDATLLLKEEWDIIIAFPPCTDLCVSGAVWFEKKRKNGTQQKSIDFFMKFVNSKCEKIVIENPVGIMSSVWRKPTQIIHPWMFGDPFEKRTCLWIKGLPNLRKTKIVKPPGRIKTGKTTMAKWYAELWGSPYDKRSKLRSKTFPGIAKAMADQWGKCKDYKYGFGNFSRWR